MIEHDNPSRPEDDAETAQLFDLLKHLEPSLEARVAFRVNVATELARMQPTSVQHSRPWWKRSISIPVPLAMALGVLLAAGILFRPDVQPKIENADVVVTAPTANAHPKAFDVPKPEPTSPTSKPPKLARCESQIYLCGVGTLKSETRYVIEE